MSRWNVLAVLAVAQFLMVLDQAVMNVAISQLVADVDAVVSSYEDAQLDALKTALLFAALIVLGSFLATAGLPRDPPTAAPATAAEAP